MRIESEDWVHLEVAARAPSPKQRDPEDKGASPLFLLGERCICGGRWDEVTAFVLVLVEWL